MTTDQLCTNCQQLLAADTKESGFAQWTDTERVWEVTITAQAVHELSARTAGMKKLPAEKLGREIFSERY